MFAFRRQQLEQNTVCGFIGGNSAVPATCGSGSHCVLDTEHNVVGCCPNGAPSCTDGVFTGCVDGNSGPQTEVNPYVFSCAGGSVCYRNMFDGGFSQWGCGTASDQAATVVNSASGLTTDLARPTVSVSYTQGISTLSEATTLGTSTSGSSSSASTSLSSSTTSTSSSSPSSSSSSSSSSSLSSTLSAALTATADPASATTTSAATAATDTTYRTGAIVGGTIGGLAVLIAIIALVFFFLRRRNANHRQGPGPGGVRGKLISPPTASGGTGFAALAHDDSDAFETGPGGSLLHQPPHQQMTMSNIAVPAATANRSLLPPLATGPPMPFQSDVSPVEHHDLDTPFAYHSTTAGAAAAAGLSAGAASVSSYPPSSSGGHSDGTGANPGAGVYHYPGQYPAAYAGAGSSGSAALSMMGMNLNRGAERHLESDQVPLTSAAAAAGSSSREIDDFSQGFHAALGRIGEEDEEEEDDHDMHGGGGGLGQVMQAGYRDDETAAAAAGLGGEEGGTNESASGQGRPLWQQNRRQSRNLMWM